MNANGTTPTRTTTSTAVDWIKAAGGDWANYAADITRTRFATPR